MLLSPRMPEVEELSAGCHVSTGCHVSVERPAISERGRQTETPESGSAVGATVCAGRPGTCGGVSAGRKLEGDRLGGHAPVPFLQPKQHLLTHVACERVDL